MARLEKVLNRLLRGTSDRNFPFRDLCWLLKKLGFSERVSGDHHIFSHEQVDEIVNLQPRGTKAKGYQVRQVREILTRYALAGDEAQSEKQTSSTESESSPPEDETHGDDSPAV